VRTTVCFPVLQFNAVKKQFVATRNVPNPVRQGLSKRSFDSMHGNQQADLRSRRSISAYRAVLVQRRVVRKWQLFKNSELGELNDERDRL
jgi:hypothetical protein